jgi:uncharacterized protein (TIRG00374 family)
MNARVIQLVIGLLCTLFFLALALYRVQLGAVTAALAEANPLWIGVAMLLYSVNLALRSWRWQLILRPVAAIPYPTVARALVVGYGLNAIMPARLGELFRAEYFKKTYGLSRVWALTSIVIERLFDGVTVIACLGVGLFLAARQNQGVLINFLLTGQFAYALAIEFAGGARALGVAAATLAQLCLLLPVAVAAAGILAHGSGTALYSILAARQSNDGRARGE